MTEKFEGTLLKWTNYWNGWQPRWFVLENGVLSYYKSEDEVDQGFKGAVNIVACEIIANQIEPCRLDVVVPGEQRFYLKSASPHERQLWLTRLGSVKSSLKSSRASHGMALCDAVHSKHCELRLYCDLLLQQVHALKQILIACPVPDPRKLDETTALLSETCDIFIATLEDCMAKSSSVLAARSSPISTEPFVAKSLASSRRSSSSSCRKQTSESGDLRGPKVVSGRLCVDASSSSSAHMLNGVLTVPSSSSSPSLLDLQVSFSADGKLYMSAFLKACESIVSIFDVLGSSAFAPIKMEVVANIRNLTALYESEPERFIHLDGLVAYSLNRVQQQQDCMGSVFNAFVLLKRSLSFVRHFISTCENDETTSDLCECANTAYAMTLKDSHSWIMRNVFSIAVKNVPNRPEFYDKLASCLNLKLDSMARSKELHRLLRLYVCELGKCVLYAENLLIRIKAEKHASE